MIPNLKIVSSMEPNPTLTQALPQQFPPQYYFQSSSILFNHCSNANLIEGEVSKTLHSEMSVETNEATQPTTEDVYLTSEQLETMRLSFIAFIQPSMNRQPELDHFVEILKDNVTLKFDKFPRVEALIDNYDGMIKKTLIKPGNISKRKWWIDEEVAVFTASVVYYAFLKEDDETDNIGDEGWRFIAGFFPSKDAEQMRQRWQTYLKNNLSKMPWSTQEDEILAMLVQQKGTKKKWKEIAEELHRLVGSDVPRHGRQCRERWNNYLDPNVNRGLFTEEEDMKLLQAFLQVGKKWSGISKLMGNRTENSVKNRFHSLIKKLKSKLKACEGESNLEFERKLVQDYLFARSESDALNLSSITSNRTSAESRDSMRTVESDHMIGSLNEFQLHPSYKSASMPFIKGNEGMQSQNFKSCPKEMNFSEDRMQLTQAQQMPQSIANRSSYYTSGPNMSASSFPYRNIEQNTLQNQQISFQNQQPKNYGFQANSQLNMQNYINSDQRYVQQTSMSQLPMGYPQNSFNGMRMQNNSMTNPSSFPGYQQQNMQHYNSQQFYNSSQNPTNSINSQLYLPLNYSYGQHYLNNWNSSTENPSTQSSIPKLNQNYYGNNNGLSTGTRQNSNSFHRQPLIRPQFINDNGQNLLQNESESLSLAENNFGKVSTVQTTFPSEVLNVMQNEKNDTSTIEKAAPKEVKSMVHQLRLQAHEKNQIDQRIGNNRLVFAIVDTTTNEIYMTNAVTKENYEPTVLTMAGNGFSRPGSMLFETSPFKSNYPDPALNNRFYNRDNDMSPLGFAHMSYLAGMNGGSFDKVTFETPTNMPPI